MSPFSQNMMQFDCNKQDMKKQIGKHKYPDALQLSELNIVTGLYFLCQMENIDIRRDNIEVSIF